MPVNDPKEFWQNSTNAENYELVRFHSWRGQLYRQLEENAIRKALQSVRKGSRVLDVPVGTGRIMSILLKEGFQALGCDISHPMMTVAKRRTFLQRKDVAFFQSEVEHLPYRDESFDAVICVGLLMHLDGETRLRALKELVRVSRKYLVLQYGVVGTFLRLKTSLTGRSSGNVRFPLLESEMLMDLRQSGVRELSRFWVLRPFSSSAVLLVTK